MTERHYHRREKTSRPAHPDRARSERRAHSGAQFVFELGSLRRQPSARRPFHGEGSLAELAVSGSVVDPDELIVVDATIEAVHEGVLVTGTASTRWHGTCRRCLEEAEGPLQVEFRELCVEDGDEETTYPLGTENLDLDPIVHDACILDLPLAPLCRNDCLGICAQCGTKRNVSMCTCEAASDPRWSELSVLSGGREDSSEETTQG